MRVVTIAGCNLPETLVRQYDLTVAPQYIVVDGENHDTRPGIPLDNVERWIKSAKTHPYVLSGSTAEFVTVYRTVAQHDREMIVIMTGRNVIGSYATATAAARVIRGAPGFSDVKIEVIDTNTIDLGSGLVTLYAALAAKEGMPLPKIVTAVDDFVQQGVTLVMPDNLEYLSKGGHASFVRTIFANMFQLRPILGLPHQKLEAVATVSRKDDPVAQLMTQAHKLFREGRSMWVGISHGRAPELGERLGIEMRKRYDVQYLITRNLQSSIYLNLGPGTLGLFLCPVDRLEHKPPHIPVGG